MSTRSSPAPVTQSAVRMIAAQINCSESEALERLRERAEYGQYRLHNYARLVVDGIVRFDDANGGRVDAETSESRDAQADSMVPVAAQEELLQLHDALVSRASIEQAKGIVMAFHGCTPEEAFARLRELSSDTNGKLRDVAEQIIRDVQKG